MILKMSCARQPKSVSVPFRGFYLLNGRNLRLMESTVSVSVPFRGFYLLNEFIRLFESKFELETFPSPSGVSIFSIMFKLVNGNYETTFPSPSGVSIFSMKLIFLWSLIGLRFRPLPGFLSSQSPTLNQL